MDERPYQLNQVAIRMVQEPPLLSKKPMNNPEAAIEVMRFGKMDRRGTRSRSAGRFLRRRPLRRNLLI